MNISLEDAELLCFASLRYGYGRKTYIVSSIADTISNIYPHLVDEQKKALLRELERALKDDDPGMDMDKEVWENLLHYMKIT